MGKAAKAKQARRAAATPPNPEAFFSQADADAAKQIRDTQSSRNPSVVVEAFFPGPIKVGDLEVAPISLGKFMLLEKIKSPLIAPAEAGKLSPEISNEQLLEAVFVLVTPAQDVRALFDDKTAWQAAIWTFSESLPLSSLSDLGQAMRTQINRAYATIIGAPAGASSGQKKTPSASLKSATD